MDGEWQQIAKLVADDGAPYDEFGSDVSISGDTAVVGARHDDDLGNDSGAAYIFREVGGAWAQVTKLTADDGSGSQEFGSGVSISGEIAIVGSNTGRVYVFRDIAGSWQQIARIVVGDGPQVSLSGGTAVVGAKYDGGGGAAYILRDIGGVWQQVASLSADDPADWYQFGQAVSIDGDTAVVGAYLHEAGATIGVAYVFREEGGVWTQIAGLVADDAADSDYTGVRVSISGGAVVLGAIADDDRGVNSGSAYVFREEGGVWQQVLKLHADDGAAYDYFGSGVSIDGHTALIGAFSDDDAGAQSGSAYVFNVAPPCPADFNADGSVNTLDVLGFLNAWAAGDASADFNGDGAVNTLDVLAFLNAWAAGC